MSPSDQTSLIPFYDEPTLPVDLVAVIGIVSVRGRENPISRRDVQAELLRSTGIYRNIRDIQDLVARAVNERECMFISDNRGYWTARDESDSEEVERAANIREAHGRAEIDDACRMRGWINKLNRTKARAA